MKIKTTRKALKEQFGNNNIFYCGYCDLQGITNKEPSYYNSGVYGWNYDVYVFDGDIAVTTGYRGMFGKKIDFNFLQKLQKEACENSGKNMWNDNNLYHTNKKAIEEKLINWLKAN